MSGLRPCVIEQGPVRAARTDTTTDLIDYAATLIARSHRTSKPVTGVLVCALPWAVRLWPRLKDAGLSCPADVSLAACDDQQPFRGIWPELTGVTCDRYQMGREAAEMVLAKVDTTGAPQASKVYQAKWIPGCTAGSVRSGGTAPRRARTRKEQTTQVGHVWPVRGGR